MSAHSFDLAGAARREMIADGFDPTFPPGTDEQIAALRRNGSIPPDAGLRDLRSLAWSSLDNDSSRDLDQIEVAERTPGGIRVLVAIADVAAGVPIGSPIDQHAAEQTTSVYTPMRVFPMLPEELSTDLTSLAEGADRAAVVIEFLVAGGGTIASSDVYRALVRNRAQLTYSAVGPWLEGKSAAPAKIAGSPELQAQLKLQDEAARSLRDQRHRLGALDFDRAETETVLSNGSVRAIRKSQKTRANDLIEDFMVSSNEVMARTLRDRGAASIRRIVKDPERWPRIVELASRYGAKLPEQPDSGALNAFLQERKVADPVRYADVSLAVMKLMGPGEYVVSRPGDPDQGHFGLAAHDYTHSTAPNRRFADLVTQRLIKSVLANTPAPYSDSELDLIARNCTQKEDAARKVERAMNKRVAAVTMQDHVGETFTAVVTGVAPKGVFVRVLDPPLEGKLVRGEQGVDVGDTVRVTLVNADPQRGFIDFAR